MKDFKSTSNVSTVVPTTIGSGSDHAYPFETTSQISNIEEHLQNLLSTQSRALCFPFY